MGRIAAFGLQLIIICNGDNERDAAPADSGPPPSGAKSGRRRAALSAYDSLLIRRLIGEQAASRFVCAVCHGAESTLDRRRTSRI